MTRKYIEPDDVLRARIYAKYGDHFHAVEAAYGRALDKVALSLGFRRIMVDVPVPANEGTESGG